MAFINEQREAFHFQHSAANVTAERRENLIKIILLTPYLCMKIAFLCRAPDLYPPTHSAAAQSE
jgi:hypothetical protein